MTGSEHHEDHVAIPFNFGSDARLAGRAAKTNPYNSSTHEREYGHWLRGWQHVDSCWGVDAKWAFKRLAEVVG